MKIYGNNEFKGAISSPEIIVGYTLSGSSPDITGGSYSLPYPIGNEGQSFIVRKNGNDQFYIDFATISGTSSGGVNSGGLGDPYFYDPTHEDFGAIGDGNSHPLNSAQAIAFNNKFGSYGMQGSYAAVAGDERDWAAIQGSLYVAAHTAVEIRLPLGTFECGTRPLRLDWIEPPATGQVRRPNIGRLRGVGIVGTVIKGTAAAGRGVVELIGSGNLDAVNIDIADLEIQMNAASHIDGGALRAGDAWCGLSLHRVSLKGSNGCILRVSSSYSYSQLCTYWNQVQIWSNWNSQWSGDQTTATVYAIKVESEGAYFDNVHFDSCVFIGLVDMRAFSALFTSCQFATPATRPYPYNGNFIMFLGNAAFKSCYFEDHYVAATLSPLIAPIHGCSFDDCWFSGINNFAGTVYRAIEAYYGIGFLHNCGPVSITNCRFRDSGYTAGSVYISYGVSAELYNNSNVDNLGNTTVNRPITVIKESTARVITHNLNELLGYDTIDYHNVIPTIPVLRGPTVVKKDYDGSVDLSVENASITGAGVYSSLTLNAGTYQGRLVTFGDEYPTLFGQVWLLSLSSRPVILGVEGAEVIRVQGDGLTTYNAVDGAQGLIAQNLSNGSSAYARVMALNDQSEGVQLVSFGSNHSSLPGQSWIYTTGDIDLKLGKNNNVQLTIGTGILSYQDSIAGPVYNLIKNNSNSASAFAATLIQNDIGSGVEMAMFGSGHTLANQAWIYTGGAQPMILGVAGESIINLGIDKQVKIRETLKVGGVLFEATASTTLTNSITEISVVPTGVGTVVIPVNMLIAGTSIDIEAFGYLSTIGAETITLKFTVQGVVVCSKVMSFGGPVTNVGWNMRGHATIWSPGVSGSIIGQGTIIVNDTVLNVVSGSTDFINTTATSLVDLTAKHSVMDPGNTIITTAVTIKVTT